MKILIPVDGSPNALRALKYTVELASDLRSKVELVVINVHEDLSMVQVEGFLDYYYLDYKTIEEMSLEASRHQLESAQKVLSDCKLKHSYIVERGPVADTIVNVATKEHFDLIVMGSKGRSTLVDLLLGSVAQSVMVHAKPPVLLVK